MQSEIFLVEVKIFTSDNRLNKSQCILARLARFALAFIWCLKVHLYTL